MSNIYGHAIDALWAREASHLGTICRFADDAVIVCRTEAAAQQALGWLQQVAQALKLRLHPEKTRIVDLNGGADGFDFLGFHIRMVKSWKYQDHYYCQLWPSRRAMASVRAKIKTIAGPRWRWKEPISAIVTELNQVLRGWGNYFRWGNSSRQFSWIDMYVRERLALFDSKKRGRSGRCWARAALERGHTANLEPVIHKHRRGRRKAVVHDATWFSRLGIITLSGMVRYHRDATATT